MGQLQSNKTQQFSTIRAARSNLGSIDPGQKWLWKYRIQRAFVIVVPSLSMSVNTFFCCCCKSRETSLRLLRAKELSLVQGEVREIERTRKMGQIGGGEKTWGNCQVTLRSDMFADDLWEIHVGFNWNVSCFVLSKFVCDNYCCKTCEKR